MTELVGGDLDEVYFEKSNLGNPLPRTVDDANFYENTQNGGNRKSRKSRKSRRTRKTRRFVKKRKSLGK